MVGSLTVGKKKYAEVEAEMYELKAKCDKLQAELLQLIERDAEVFEPLSRHTACRVRRKRRRQRRPA